MQTEQEVLVMPMSYFEIVDIIDDDSKYELVDRAIAQKKSLSIQYWSRSSGETKRIISNIKRKGDNYVEIF